MKTLTAVITTRNEAANIATCIHAFDAVRTDVELIVVDNNSTDETKAIAASLGAIVLDKGPERSAQRNLGWRTATAEWVVILDADVEPAPGDGRFDFVGVDNFEIGKFVGRHVIERGARTVAFVAWSDMNDNSRRRLDGLRAAISEKRGVRFAGSSMYTQDGAKLADKWARRLPTR